MLTNRNGYVLEDFLLQLDKFRLKLYRNLLKLYISTRNYKA